MYATATSDGACVLFSRGYDYIPFKECVPQLAPNALALITRTCMRAIPCDENQCNQRRCGTQNLEIAARSPGTQITPAISKRARQCDEDRILGIEMIMAPLSLFMRLFGMRKNWVLKCPEMHRTILARAVMLTAKRGSTAIIVNYRAPEMKARRTNLLRATNAVAFYTTHFVVRNRG